MFNLERRQILQRRIDRLRGGMASMDQLNRAAATQELSAMETELNKLHDDTEVLGPALATNKETRHPLFKVFQCQVRRTLLGKKSSL